MILLTRAVARAFRTLASKCVAGRARGPAPPVVLHQADGVLVVSAAIGEVVLSWTGPATGDPVTLTVPMKLLDTVDGPEDDSVAIERDNAGRVVARRTDRGVPRTRTEELVPTESRHRVPDPPTTWSGMPAGLLAALHDAGRTAAQEPTRYALHRVQLRGKKGQVIGSDGKRAYLKGGFAFPFSDDLLVPAVPVFGAKEWASAGEVRLGRTVAHLVVAAGPWTVAIAIDATGKFPDVAGVLPKHLPTVVGIDDRDGEALLDALPGLPVADGELDPVNFAVDGGVFVRAGAGADAVEIYLARSTFSGPDGMVPVARADLRRLLALGCRTIRFVSDSKPFVGEGDQLTFAAMPLDARCVNPQSATLTRLATDDAGQVVPRIRSDRREDPATIPIPSVSERTAMKPTDLPPTKPESNGESLDPLAEAEGLRNALTDVITRVARLVAALRHMKREKRALATVWSSLKDLNLGA
jgi:hypothetical protein